MQNMADYPFEFVPALDPRQRPGPGLWFAFHGRSMLVDERYQVPLAESPEQFGVAAVRTQFLGRLNGQPCYSAELAAEFQPPEGMQMRLLRELLVKLAGALPGIAARAAQIVDWDRNNQFCGACGSPTDYHPRHRARVCTAPSCRLQFYPRLSPAIIVAVERGPEILLGRSPHFPPGIYSVLAGFVDPGESLEDAVHREVFEETGIRIARLRYFGSQTWPFPDSLMVGFQAEYEGGEVRPDPEELEDAAFYHVNALPQLIPGNLSISQWLLRDFLRRHGRGWG